MLSRVSSYRNGSNKGADVEQQRSRLSDGCSRPRRWQHVGCVCLSTRVVLIWGGSSELIHSFFQNLVWISLLVRAELDPTNCFAQWAGSSEPDAFRRRANFARAILDRLHVGNVAAARRLTITLHFRAVFRRLVHIALHASLTRYCRAWSRFLA